GTRLDRLLCAPHDARVAVDLEPLERVEDELGTRGLGLLLHDRAEVVSRDPLGEAGEVLDVLDVQHLPARAHEVDHRRAQTVAPAEHPGREPGETATHHHEVILLVRHCSARFPSWTRAPADGSSWPRAGVAGEEWAQADDTTNPRADTA